ncbi:DNA methyltransferase [Gordonia phage Lton]|nr:DNA methyltransferase [Gordonia phage Lton]
MPYVRNTPHWKPVFGLLNGGLDMAVNAYFGSDTAWFVEYDTAPSKILAHHWPEIPNHGDVTTIDWTTVEPVDILTGGFPCQDVSAAGRRAGLAAGTRSGLWSHMAEAINQLRPRYVVIENVRGLLSATAHRHLEPRQDDLGNNGSRPVLRAIGAVCGDLADLGYDTQWVTVAASDVGACHRRQRVFILATPAHAQRGERNPAGEEPDSSRPRHTPGEPDRPAATATHPDNPGPQGPQPARRHHMSAGGDRSHVTLLPTPRASDGTKGGPNQRGSSGDLMLPSAVVEWGPYEAAVRRTEHAWGRPAPEPTEPNKQGNPRLNAAFAEWMMGLPDGHVTAVPGLSRAEQLKAIGNGVCPPQAYRALTILNSLTRIEAAS